MEMSENRKNGDDKNSMRWYIVLGGLAVVFFVLFLLALTGVIKLNSTGTERDVRFQYQISTQWDSRLINHEPAKLEFRSVPGGVKFLTEATFFNDPPNPGGERGKPFPKLWEYEVIEVFLLGKGNRYLEVEICPHGQHIVLFLDGFRNIIKDLLPLQYNCSIVGNKWRGEAFFPRDYFPPQVTRFNAYAIHGSNSSRRYEALFPTEHGKFEVQEFHRLEYFKDIDMAALLPGNDKEEEFSDIWKKYL